MKDSEQKLTIEDLAEQVDVPVRTVRFYITEGLIPGPEGRGKATTYTEEHLLKLRLVRRLAEQRVPLVDIRAQVAGLAPAEVRALLVEQAERDAELASAVRDASPRDYVATLLNRARSIKEPPVAQGFAAAPSLSSVSGQSASPEGGQVWKRWELASGVELHVRDDARQRYQTLIQAVLRAAGKSRTP